LLRKDYDTIITKKESRSYCCPKSCHLQFRDMENKIKGLKAMIKMLIKNQNHDLNDKDIKHMMSHFLGKEKSLIDHDNLIVVFCLAPGPPFPGVKVITPTTYINTN